MTAAGGQRAPSSEGSGRFSHRQDTGSCCSQPPGACSPPCASPTRAPGRLPPAALPACPPPAAASRRRARRRPTARRRSPLRRSRHHHHRSHRHRDPGHSAAARLHSTPYYEVIGVPSVPADAAAGQSSRSVASGAGGAGPRRGGTCSVVAGGCAVVGGRVATAGGRPAELHAGRWRRARPRRSCSPCGHTVRPGWEGAQECRSPKPPCPDGSNGARARCLSSYAAALLAHLRPPRRAPLPQLPPPARAPPPGAPGWSLGLARCAGRRPPPPAPPPAE